MIRKYSNYIIVDLEATCEKDVDYPHEIIEIGAVKVQVINNTPSIVDEFVKFVKPKLNHTLTDFCKELTSITQEDVNNAAGFPTALKEFRDWMGEDWLMCSWGFYDRKQFLKDSVDQGIDESWLPSSKHISLKHQYSEVVHKTKKRFGLGKAIRKEGFVFEGIAHRGIDDARNIAKIFVKYFDKWE